MNGRKRRGAVVAVFSVLTVVSAACSGGGSSASSNADAGAPVSFDVSLSEFQISPSSIQAPAGRPMTFNITNDGQAPHTFAVDTGAGVEATQEIAPGASTVLSVPELEAGEYRLSCTISGHADLGMVGSLIVGPGVAAGALSATGASGMAGMSGGSVGDPMTAEQMAESHKAGVEAFPAETQGTGNKLLKPTVENGVKVFTLTATDIKWETSPGSFVDAMAYNGQIPGPELHVSYGDHVRIIVNNDTSQPTVVHFHGLTVPNAMDGVPYITQDPIMPGAFFTYEFTVQDPPGMYVYHSHFNSTEQVGKGLYGAFYIDPPKGAWPYHELSVNDRTGETTVGPQVGVDDEFTLFLADGPLGYVLNGKGFPATQPIVAKTGDWVLIHIANDGAMLHPMHLHGYHFEVVAQDGFPLEKPYMADTLVVAPGQRFDILVDAIYPGAWAFHCHILPHVEGPAGMYGMVTALVVQ
jgi:FtsP/CotA-like multicopper oxidase with cupredoxin domain/plastocyanin